MFLRSKLIFLCLFLCVTGSLMAQQRQAAYTYSVSGEVFGGFIIKHRDVIGHLIKGHPTGFRVGLYRYSYGHKAWEQRYGYPTLSVLLGYYNLKNDQVLGRALALNTGLIFHLNDITRSRNDFQVHLGFGLSYVSKTYDKDNNNKNNVISTHFPWSIYLRLAYDRQLSDRLKAGIAMQMSHFSNAARKLPNLGLNVVNLSVGMKYALSDARPEYRRDQLQSRDFDKKSYVNFDIRIGFNEKQPIGSGRLPYLAMAAFWNKRVGVKSIVDAGLEGFFNFAYRSEIENNYPEPATRPDYRSLSVMLGHELVLDKFALVTQTGVYFYKPYLPGDWLYFKIGFKYYFNQRLYASMILKSHFAVAEVLEYGVGFRL